MIFKGAPSHGLGKCPKGPCAAMFGPCIQDGDCLYGNVCVDDSHTCKNFVFPCCQRKKQLLNSSKIGISVPVDHITGVKRSNRMVTNSRTDFPIPKTYNNKRIRHSAIMKSQNLIRKKKNSVFNGYDAKTPFLREFLMLDAPIPYTQDNKAQDGLHTEATLRSGQNDKIKLDEPFLLKFLRLEHLDDAKTKANHLNDRQNDKIKNQKGSSGAESEAYFLRDMLELK